MLLPALLNHQRQEPMCLVNNNLLNVDRDADAAAEQELAQV